MVQLFWYGDIKMLLWARVGRSIVRYPVGSGVDQNSTKRGDLLRGYLS